ELAHPPAGDDGVPGRGGARARRTGERVATLGGGVRRRPERRAGLHAGRRRRLSSWSAAAAPSRRSNSPATSRREGPTTTAPLARAACYRRAPPRCRGGAAGSIRAEPADGTSTEERPSSQRTSSRVGASPSTSSTVPVRGG